jgi:REP element-mobilizing transposase RayT
VSSDPTAFPELRFLGEFSEIQEFRNRLPHWHLKNAACFITFRLADSIPSSLLTEWRSERERWLKEHPKPWCPASESEYHKQFSTRIDRMLDAGHGSCLLAVPENAEITADTLTRRNQTDYLLHSHVIMPNHVHVLISPLAGKPLSSAIAGWKRFSATRIHKASGNAGSLWQKDYFDRLIRDWDHFLNVARYIRRNPVKAGLAEECFLLDEAPWVQRLLS